VTTTTGPTAIERLRRAGAATVHEALGRIGAMDSAIKPLDTGMRVAGRALTVDSAPADNLMIQYAVAIARPGDVLVVDAKAFTEAGPWGDLLTLHAQLVGIAGLVIDGAVRDSREIVAMGFPVFCRAVCIKGTGKYVPGGVNVTVQCGGVTVHPGDIVVGDADGVVVVPAADLDRAALLSTAREKEEEAIRETLRNGSSLIDLMGLRGRLHALGYDRAPEPLQDRADELS
jgi:4-hydroxy-4-methyl-2-oxoglutarate aldolase